MHRKLLLPTSLGLVLLGLGSGCGDDSGAASDASVIDAGGSSERDSGAPGARDGSTNDASAVTDGAAALDGAARLDAGTRSDAAVPDATMPDASFSGETFEVSDTAGLESALSSASGGDRILLAPGNYDRIDATNVNFDSHVTIASADPNNCAVAYGARIRDSSFLRFVDLCFEYEGDNIGDGVKLFAVDDSHDIHVFRSRLTGFRDSEGYGHGIGFAIGGGSVDVLIRDNTVSYFAYGVASGGSTRVSFIHNDISKSSADGMQFISVVGLLVERNYIHDAEKSPSSGVHQDHIQMFSRVGGLPSRDVTIRANVLDVGNGNVPQGIFLGNEAFDDGDGEAAYYRNFLIEGNVIYGARYAGIRTGQIDGIVIRNNSALQIPAADLSPRASGFVGPEYAPVIAIRNECRNASLTDNVAAAVSDHDGVGWSSTGNVAIDLEDYPMYFTAASLAAGVPHNWVVLRGSAIDGVGAAAF